MSEKIEFNLEVNKNELSPALDDASKKASKLEANLETAVAVFAGNLLTKAFDSFLDGLDSIISFTGEAIDAAAGQEVAVNNLNAALARAGNFTKEASDELRNFASQLQATTKFEDDAVIGATALLQSLTNLTADGLQKGVSAAADFATVLGVDLETATRLVAKAANGQTEAFARYGISVEKAGTNSETFNRILVELNKNFGGAATSQLNTYNGSLVALQNAYADLLEPIGDIVVQNPIVIGTFNAIKNILNELNGSISENNSVFKELVSDGIFAAVAATEVLFDALDGITRVGGALVATITTLGDAVALGLIEPFRLAFDAITSILSALPIVGEQFASIQNPLDGIAESLRTGVVGGIQDVQDALSGNIFTQLSEGASKLGNDIIILSEQAALGAQNIQNSNANRVQDERDTNANVIAERAKLNADILALSAKVAAEQATFEEEIRIAGLASNEERNIATIDAILTQKQLEADAIFQGELAKNELIKDAESKRLADQLAFQNKEAASEKAFKDAKKAKEIAFAQGQLNLQKTFEAQKNQIMSSSFGLAAALAKDGSKEQFLIQKAAALAEIAIARGKAIALIPAQTAHIPFPGNVAPAAALAANANIQAAIGAATVVATAIKGFAGGGIVGGGATSGPDDQLATVRSGEMILNAEQQKNLFNMINNGGGGGDIVIQIDRREIARAVRDEIRSGFKMGVA